MTARTSSLPRILIIEDELELREIFFEALSERYECGFALTEREILDEARGVSSVLMAWPIPGLDCESLFAHCHKFAPVVVLPLDPSLVPSSVRPLSRMLEKPFGLQELERVTAESVASERTGIYLGNHVRSTATASWGAGRVVDISGTDVWVEFESSGDGRATRCRREHLQRIHREV